MGHRLAFAAASVIAIASIGQSQALPSADPLALPKQAPIEQVQFFNGGGGYCFYPNGWHGPGFYRCGFAFRRGFGWGGPRGWGGPPGFRGGGGRGFHGGIPGGGRGGFGGPHGGFGGGHGGAGAGRHH